MAILKEFTASKWLSETTIETNMKTMDSKTYTLGVNKHVTVPDLKEQIASMTRVLSEQYLIYCGRALGDDHPLSDNLLKTVILYIWSTDNQVHHLQQKHPFVQHRLMFLVQVKVMYSTFVPPPLVSFKLLRQGKGKGSSIILTFTECTL
ncbi:hypothetical protein LguiA_021254 [Lonicera macranthoides]